MKGQASCLHGFCVSKGATSLSARFSWRDSSVHLTQRLLQIVPSSSFCLLLKLFDLVYREETLLNVIKSVTRNGRSIILTAVLALILVYLFSIVGYLFFKDDFILEVDRLPNETALPGGGGMLAYSGMSKPCFLIVTALQVADLSQAGFSLTPEPACGGQASSPISRTVV